MKYVCLDTNIYITCARMRRSHRHTPSLLRMLIKHAESNGAVLLLPEVVDAEVHRILKEEPGEKSVLRTLDNQNIMMVPLTPSAMTKATLWTIRGDRPARKNTAKWNVNQDAADALDMARFKYGVEQDCLILASLAEFMEDKTDDDLVICAEDKGWYSDGAVARSIALRFSGGVVAHDSLVVLLKEEFNVDVDRETAAEHDEALRTITRLVSLGMSAAIEEFRVNIGVAAAELVALADEPLEVVDEPPSEEMRLLTRTAHAAFSAATSELATGMSAFAARLDVEPTGSYVEELGEQGETVLRWAEDASDTEDTSPQD